MPSASLQRWKNKAMASLDEIEAAHRGIGGAGRGRRYATQQINHAYAVLLSSQFQGFCRDLHTECVEFLSMSVGSSALRIIFRQSLLQDRKLDKGNPIPSHVQRDFLLLGLDFLAEVKQLDKRNNQRLRRLEELNTWRNAIAHQDFSKLAGFSTQGSLGIASVREWRRACDQLAVAFDAVMKQHCSVTAGSTPW